MRDGLLTGKDQTGFGAVFLTDRAKPSTESFDVWAVDCSGLELEPDDVAGQDEGEYGQWWMTFEDIAADRLTRLPPAINKPKGPSVSM